LGKAVIKPSAKRRYLYAGITSDTLLVMDLSKYFDMLDHDLIIKFVRKRITDSRILNLIKQFLKSGVMVGSAFESSELGSLQGGVISPLLSNIYLDEFDQEMMKR
jgi:RNA-directed DNA polymerase